MKVFSFLATDLYHVVWKCMTIFSTYSFSLDIASRTDYLIKVLSHTVTADLAAAMYLQISTKEWKCKESPWTVLETHVFVYFCVVQSQLELMLCLCWVIGRFDLRPTFHLFICHPLRVLPLITLTHSSVLFEHGEKNIIYSDKTGIYQSVSAFVFLSGWRFFSLSVTLFNLESFKQQICDWSVVFVGICTVKTQRDALSEETAWFYFTSHSSDGSFQ